MGYHRKEDRKGSVGGPWFHCSIREIRGGGGERKERSRGRWRWRVSAKSLGERALLSLQQECLTLAGHRLDTCSLAGTAASTL